MSDNRSDRETAKLRTLERWRTVELEDAQAHYAEMARIADEKQQEVGRVEDSIASMQSYHREQLLGSASLSVESLRRVLEFSAQQAGELKQAKSALEVSQENSTQAQEAMTARFEQLAVVEKLRERRQTEIARELLQAQQKQLDEHAMNRAGIVGDSGQRHEQEK